MSYNQQAESFSSRVNAPFVPHDARFSYPAGWSTFDQCYAEIADATPTDRDFRASSLIGQLPLIAHFAPKTQAEIIRVVIRDMQALPAEADGLVRVKGGVYAWRFADREAVA